ncbi:hypothetical protein AYO44_12210 [Planctomycetaceae bacterium SCGC AG-212-F19]|nr:hypothetical protein AYO44_12210 [Planctomycetaceae bacterium SCGC AG-212-F19]
MSWQGFESAVRSIFAKSASRARNSKRRSPYRPFIDALEERVVPTSYSTNFPNTETPISEGGHWINGGTNGIDWGNVNTTPGYAVGVSPPNAGFDDATALLTGTWGPDQSAQATVRVGGSVFDHPEVELRLRSSISAHVNNGYEITESVAGAGNDYLIIVRWNGPLNDFSYLTVTNPGNYTGSFSVTTGDVVKATIVGNVISAYKNGVLIGQAVDPNNTYTSGNPGFGFNLGVNGDYGYTNYSATDSLTTTPPAPTGLTATTASGQVALSWNPSAGATSYNLYRSTGTGTPSLYKTGLNSTSFTDTGLTNGTQYNYQVTAVNTAGESGKSNQVSATPTLSIPGIPTGLTAAPGNNQIGLSWAASAGATSYNIYRSTSSGTESLLTSGIATNSYTDAGLTNGTSYFYKVTAVNTAGESGKSSEASATPQAKPPGHVQTNAADVSSASNSVAFTSATGSGDLVVAEISFNNNVNFSSITDSQGNTWVQIGAEQNSTSFGIKSRLYYAKNIKGGPLTVTSQLSGSAAFHELYIHEYTGLDPTNPLDAFSVNTATGSSFTSNNLTTTAANDLLYGVEIDSASASAAAGWTTRSTLDGNVAADKSAPTVGAYAYTGTSSGAFIAWEAAFKPASGPANQPPTVATAASASPSSVTGTTTALSVLGADDGGEANLIYTWAATTLPSGATPSFSANGTNAAKNSTVTFNKAGSYTFQVTIKDGGGLTVASSVNVTVNQTLTSIAVSPSTVSLADGATQSFSATAKDQFGTALTTQPTFAWSIDTGGVGSVNSSSGLYTAPTSGSGSATVRATSASISGTATVTVNNQPPTVATAASALPSSVTGMTTALSVLGADDGGEANLIYTWAATTLPSGATPSFSANGTNAAKNSTVTFNKAGSYTFQVTIKDGGGLTVASSVNVTVNQALATIVVSPGSASVADGATQVFTATAKDQFGNALTTQPTFTWSIDSGGVGTVNSSSGLYTAPTSGSGTATVRATSGPVSGTAAVSVSAQANPPAHVQTNSADVSSASNSVAFATATKPGDLVVAEISFNNNVNFNSITDNQGNTWVQIGAEQNSTSFGIKSRLYYAKNIKGGLLTVTSQLSGAAAFHELYIHEYTGVDTTNPLDAFSVNTATGSSFTSNNLTTTTANDLLYGIEIDSASASAAAGWTTRSTLDGNVAADKSAPTVGAYAYTGSSSGAYMAWIAAFKPASGSVNQPPTVAAAASSSANPVSLANLSVLGADDGGEANLTYTWAATSIPSGATPTFSANGTNAAKNTAVTFNKAGSYTFQVTIKDGPGLTATSTVNATVNATLTSITVSPASATVADGATQPFAATAKDQFSIALSTQPAITWSLGSGSVGTVSNTGLYTAPASGTGSATVQASSGSVTGTAGVSVTSPTLFTAHINFTGNFSGPGTPTTPGTVAGYINDTGLVYGNNGGGLTFGWSADNTANGRDRQNPSSPDELHDSLIHMQTPSNTSQTFTWSIAVPNGTYTIHVLVGDPSNADVVSKLTVNGVLTVGGSTSNTTRWLEGTTTLTVTAGKLTVAEQAGAYDKIDAIDITQASPEMLAGSELVGSHAARLTQKQLDRVVAEAIQLWAATGLSPAQVATLQHVHFVIADLPANMLGAEAGATITIDANAAGFGWSLGQHVAPHKVDLLTVVAHELGHELGLSDLNTQTNSGNIMDDTLAPGIRRLP